MVNRKKLTEKFLCVDTNILIQCCFLEIDGDDLEVLTKLHVLLDGNKVILLLPEIIKLEFYKRFATKKNLLISEINRHKEDIKKSGGLNDGPKKELERIFDKYIKEKEELADKVKKEIESIFDHKNTIQKGLEITPEVFIETYKYFFSYLKPFKKETRNEKEKPDIIQSDCLIIEILKRFFFSKEEYKLYFCSQNVLDFAEDIRDGSFRIHKDIEKHFKNISLSNNLGTVLKKEFKITISDKVIKQLESVNEKDGNIIPSLDKNDLSGEPLMI